MLLCCNVVSVTFSIGDVFFFPISIVFCKTSLCKKETFADLAGWLTKKDISLTQRRVAVYLLSVLVANNSKGFLNSGSDS